MKTLLAGLLALSANVASAGAPAPAPRFAVSPVPTLDEAALMVLAVVVGGVAGWAVKRRRDRK